MTGRRVATTTTDRADAVQRALRTLRQGVLLDALGAIGVGLALLLADADVTSGAFWGAFGILVIKSLLTSLASYLQRLRKAPPPLPLPDTTSGGANMITGPQDPEANAKVIARLHNQP